MSGIFHECKKEFREKYAQNVDLAFKELGNLGINVSDEDLYCSYYCGLGVYRNNILLDVLGDIERKDGLVRLSDIINWKGDIYEFDFFNNYYRFSLSKFFRRGSRLDTLLLEELPSYIFRMYREGNNNIWIRLEEDFLRIDTNRSKMMELERLYGPSFNNVLSKIKTGETVHFSPNENGFLTVEDFMERSTIFKEPMLLKVSVGEKDQRILNFQFFEYRQQSISTVFGGNRFIKYIHAHIDRETNFVEHFDGAVHVMSSENFKLEVENLIAGNNVNYSQKAQSIKLFRCDGISFDNFKYITALFFRKNHLVCEYFDGADGQPLK